METLDYRELALQLDRTKSRVFMGKNAAFMGSLLCSMEIIWDETQPTAWTNGSKVGWNPHFFLSLKPEVRETVLMHELWHPGQLYFVRRGDRDPHIFNIAADIWTNNNLKKDGYSFEGIEWVWMDPQYDVDKWSIEMIYDDLIAKGMKPPPQGGWNGSGGGDVQEPTQQEKQQAINAVVQAITAAKHAGQPGHIPGNVETILKKFLAPIIPWEQKLYKFFNDMLDMDYSWKVRDRRFQNIYLPGEESDGGRLESLNWYFDVSGSVTDAQAVRFMSEAKYIKDTFNPIMMRLIQFDTRITSVTEFTEDDPFEEIVIIGRGGTLLSPVREHIEQSKPTAAVIFSDLYCAPMEPLDHPVPIIWVAIDNYSAKVPFGDQLIHIKA